MLNRAEEVRLLARSIIIACFVSLCCAQGLSRTEERRVPPVKRLTEAEAILDRLERLDAAFDGRESGAREASRRTFISLRLACARLDESRLKTELATAIRLYVEATALDAGDNIAALTDLLEKARAHLKWAQALILQQKGALDRATSQALSELEAERRLERTLTARALDMLKSLEGDVRIYNSLAEFEDGRSLSNISFNKFDDKLRAVAQEVSRLLHRLPEDRLRQYLHNALRSYLDGSFWWKKASRPAVIDAGAIANGLVESKTETTGPLAFDLSRVAYTVAIHWRQAQRFTRRAELLYLNER